jgi:hypothetical protein
VSAGPRKIRRLLPSVERQWRGVTFVWPRGVKTHPDLCIVVHWIGWAYPKGIRRPERPRNIAGVEGGHYWHWPLGLGYIDWFGQRLYR